jgi:predicted RNase H-like HicB family nuclease
MKQRTLNDYLKLSYVITLIPEGNCWFAEIKDLPGCMTQGETRDEALELIEEARHGWIKTAFKIGMRVPFPGEHTATCIPQTWAVKTRIRVESKVLSPATKLLAA